MAKFDTTGYLVVKISDPHNEKNNGRKCIPARWAEKSLSDNYLIIRYPLEENCETRMQVINKEPSNKAWLCYCALNMFRSDSYEKAIEFIKENDEKDSRAAIDVRPDNTMNETKACDSATPSTSGKHKQSEENNQNSTNADNLPKKKRESAIRSGNKLKRLIENKQLHYFPKQKVATKKVLSLRKEALTETLEALISAGKFNKIEKLYDKTVAAKSRGLTVHEDNIVTDDSDSNNEPEVIPPPDRSIIVPVLENEPSIANTTTNPERTATVLLETVDFDLTKISSPKNLNQQKESKTKSKENQSLSADITALQNLIRNVTPDNGNKPKNITDIKHVENIYNSILETKSKMNAVYQEKSIQLKKAFESINLIVPELKQGLSLPTIEQIKENSQSNSEKPKAVSTRHDESSQSSNRSTSFKSQSAKWTLKHQGPGYGLTELIPNTGVYVSELELDRCKLLGKDMRQFARLLLPVIFSNKALSKCFYTGKGRTGKYSKNKVTRLGLDEHARNVLMDYVNKHAKESGWVIVSPGVMIQSLRDKVRVWYNIHQEV